MTSYPGGTATGEHPDIIVIDDPISADNVGSLAERDEQRKWYFETLSSRGIGKNISHIVTQQRLHVEDLSGYIAAFDKRLRERGIESPWHHLFLPMRYNSEHVMVDRGYGGDWRTKDGELLFPERIDEKECRLLELALSEQGPWAVDAQLGQNPTRRDGSFFKTSKINEIPRSMFPTKYDEIVRFWDLAGTEDEKACATAGAAIGRIGTDPMASKYYMINLVREQIDANDVSDLMERTAKKDVVMWGGETITGKKLFETYFEREPASSGKLVAGWLERKLMPFGIRNVPSVKGKESRARPLASIIKDGLFYVAEGEPETALFISELETFPSGKIDTVDAAAGAVKEMVQPHYKETKKAVASLTREEKRKPKSPCKNPDCNRPLFNEETGYCCECCQASHEQGVDHKHTPLCSSKYNDWWVANSR